MGDSICMIKGKFGMVGLYNTSWVQSFVSNLAIPLPRNGG